MAGIADEVGLAADGRPEVVVDWKSDVAPAFAAIDRYRSQVRSYLEVTGACRGMIVFVTSGTVVHV